MHAIETENLSRRFGRLEAVAGLTCSVPHGSIFALIGPNGAGKTTTIKLLLNLLHPSGGHSKVLGKDSQELGPADLEEVGYVSENQEMPDWMAVDELIAFCRPLYRTWDDPFCRHLIAQFGLPLRQKIRHLSRGFRSKLALLCALAYHPRLIFLDEPFTGLDALVREELVRALLELAAQREWTIFVSSHDIDELENLVDRVAILDKGRLQLCESVESLQARFRKVELIVDDGAVPTPAPPEWILPQFSGHTLQFVHSLFSKEAEQSIRAQIPSAKHIRFVPMSLKSIFITLARTYRAAGETTTGG